MRRVSVWAYHWVFFVKDYNINTIHADKYHDPNGKSIEQE